MKLRTICAVYAVLVGLGIAATWAVYFLTGSIFGIEPAPLGLGFHIAAELIAAVVMLAAAAGLAARKAWGPRLFFLAMGMLIYAVINSPGYYLGSPGGKLMLGVFGGSLLGALVFTVLGLKLKRGEKK